MVEKLPTLNRALTGSTRNPDRIIQFGTGNFLKGFLDWIVQQLNDRAGFGAGVVAVKLRPGNDDQLDSINAQDGLFTVNVRGIEDGQLVDECQLVACRNRALSPYRDFQGFLQLAELPTIEWVVSNTTEAGIRFDDGDLLNAAPAETFPGKLTQFLYRRYRHFQGDSDRGLKIFCCELIEDNAAVLREIVLRYSQLWQLEDGFLDWLGCSCHFYNTLVDRIVTGRPNSERREVAQRQFGYVDKELVETESYYQWVIQVESHGKADLERCFPRAAGLNIVLTSDLKPYRQRKVRILNGAHSGCVAPALLLGLDTVYEAMGDKDLGSFMKQLVYSEICPTISMPQGEVEDYADAILERFENPFLRHEWRSISLNSLSKWRARLLPVLKDARQIRGEVPPALAASLASLLLLYSGKDGRLSGELQDDPEGIALLNRAWRRAPDYTAVVRAALSERDIWGEDLATDTELVEVVGDLVREIQLHGVRACLQKVNRKAEKLNYVS